MKKIAIFVLAVAAALPAMSQTFTDKLMNRYNYGYGDAVLLGGLARDFGLDDSVINDLRNRYGYRNDDMLPAIYANRYGRADWDDIYRMRRQGMGWGQIAHSIGMHPGDFNKARKNNRWANDREFMDDIWNDRFSRKGTRLSDVSYARSRGMSHTDAYIADQISRYNKRGYQTVVNNYSRSRAWTPTRDDRNSIGRVAAKPAKPLRRSRRPSAMTRSKPAAAVSDRAVAKTSLNPNPRRHKTKAKARAKEKATAAPSSLRR